MDPKSLKNLLSDANSALGALAGRAATMVELRDVVAASLDTEHGAHVSDANLGADNTLIVVCDSPAWTARLRFDADTMLAAARKAGFYAGRCRVVTRPVRP